MSDTDTKTKIAARTFKDAGTLQRFERGKPVEATPGQLANYEAAGLATSNHMVFSNAVAVRVRERGPCKLARRMRRKRELGMLGAF